MWSLRMLSVRGRIEICFGICDDYEMMWAYGEVGVEFCLIYGGRRCYVQES
jgi:hypothetical protein